MTKDFTGSWNYLSEKAKLVGKFIINKLKDPYFMIPTVASIVASIVVPIFFLAAMGLPIMTPFAVSWATTGIVLGISFGAGIAVSAIGTGCGWAHKRWVASKNSPVNKEKTKDNTKDVTKDVTKDITKHTTKDIPLTVRKKEYSIDFKSLRDKFENNKDFHVIDRTQITRNIIINSPGKLNISQFEKYGNKKVSEKSLTI